MTVEIGTIYNEDCIETMRRMEEGSIDMILTSPPYDDIRDYKGYSFDFEGVAAGMLRILKEDEPAGGGARTVETDLMKITAHICESIEDEVREAV